MKKITLVGIVGVVALVSLVIMVQSRSSRVFGPAKDAKDINAQFARVNQPRGWIGGDGGASLKLPDGRIMYMWADSFIGTVSTNNTYGPFYKLVRNSLTTSQPDGSDFKTYVSGTVGKETSYVPNVDARPNNHLWPYSGMVSGDNVVLLANEWQPDKTADFGSSFTGNTWLVRLSLPSLGVESREQIITNDPIEWGSALYSEGDYSYVLGHLDNKTYIYRTPTGQLGTAPQYYTNKGWSTNRSEIKPISSQNLQAIIKVDGKYRAIFMKKPFPKAVYETYATSITGPWTQVSQSVYNIPEARNKKLLEYMPRIHESLSSSGSYVMSYSVNAYDIRDLPGNASYYHPQFFKGPNK